jgi:hypothetical protein
MFNVPFQHKCHSEQHAMVYESDEHEHNYLTSRDLDLTSADDSDDDEELKKAAFFSQDFFQTAAIKG